MEVDAANIDLPIETARLTLRAFLPEDAASILELYGDPEVVRYLYTEPMRPEELAGSMERRIGNNSLRAEGDTLELAATLRSSGEFVGVATFMFRSLEHRRGEIGYTVLPAFAGQGFASECGVALLRIGFEQVGLHRVEAQCDARNRASERVMERIGMRREAHLRENEFVKGEWTDELIYALLADEWRAPTTED